MRHFNIARKAVAILVNLSLLLNSFLPFLLAIKPAYAQSAEDLSPTPTPVEIVENSPTPTPEIVISETPTPTPTVEPTVTPEVSPTVIPTISPEATPEATPTSEITPTPENNQSNDNSDNNDNKPVVEITPTLTPIITPTPTPTVEQVCLADSDSIRNSVELDWNYNSEKDIYETREKVQLGVKYVFPQDNNTTVTFKCLPKDEVLRSTLKIKRVKTSDLKLPNIENVSDYAYDITTDMRDGIFKYDITLPKLSESTAKVSYIEKSIEEATLVPVTANEVKSIENLEQQSDSVKATDVDHFTIFITTGVWPTTSDDDLVSGEGTAQIRWPKNKNPQSGLGFVGVSGLDLESLTSNGNAFTFGTLTHYNHPVSAAIIWADLKITLGLSTPRDFTFRIQIDETSNTDRLSDCTSGFQLSNTPCDDKVTFPNSISNQIVTVGGIDYTLIIDGFKKTVDGATLSSFITEEDKDNSAFLVGHFTPVGRIIVDKVTNPAGDNTSFSFTTTGAGYNSFSLTDSATPNNQVLPANRTYSVSESTVSGWTKINTNCISSIGDSESVNSLELDAGETITCTFTNAKNVASLRVVKNVVPANDSGKFNLLINGSQYATNVGNNGETGYKTVSTGTVNFGETAGTNTNLSDYTVSYSASCANGQTTLSIGETKTCTITNTRKAYCGDGIINGSETCDGSNLGSYSSTDFQCNNCSIELKESKVTICHSSSSNSNPYITNQPDKSGDVSGHASDNGPVWYPGITVQWGDIIPPFAYVGGTFPGLNWTTEGQAIYNNGCNLPNSTLKVVKIVDNTGGGNKSATDFKFSLNGSSYTNFGIGGSNTYTLKIGDTYSITESPEFSSSYSVSFNNCSGTIDSTQEVCTITNTYTPKCGDGIVNSGEQCDDANSVNTDSCTNSCKSATCGDGLIWTGNEICDDGAANDTTCSTAYGTVDSCSYCDATLCTIKTINNPVCGDGIVDSAFGEECDDANSVNTDSCTNTCKAATCGDGFIQFGEKCDGSNLGGLPSSDYSCNRTCELNLVNPKVTICHSTDSYTNPYNVETPNKSGDLNGHASETGPVWFPNITVDWGDIIPPFAYIGGNFPGLNWSPEGQAIYNNGCDLPKGTLIIKKVLINDNGGNKNFSDFSFKIGDTSYTFENDGQNDITLNPGKYTVTENSAIGYTTTYNNCSNITVPISGTVTCTITNNDIAPKLKLSKIVVNDNGGNKTASSWTLRAQGTIQSFSDTGDSTTFHDVKAGVTYDLSESGPTGYTKSSWTCTGGEASGNTVKLSSGDQVTCSITNNDIAPQLNVVKKVVPDTNSGKFNLFINGTQYATDISNNGETGFQTVKANTTINFSETAGTNTSLSDYTTTYSPSCANGQTTLSVGESKICTITNTRKTGTLQIKKNVDLNGDRDYNDSGETNATDWQWQAVGPENVNGNTGEKKKTVVTGEYTLTETQKENFYQVNLTCTGGTLNGNKVTVENNKNVVCTFVNARDTGTVTVIKKINPTSDSGLFNLKVDGSIKKYFATNNSSTGKVTVITGNHTISEEGALLTDISNYSSSISCDDGASTIGTSMLVNITKGKDLICTITNVRLGTIIVQKQTTPISFETFDYKFNSQNNSFFNGDIDIHNKLTPGTYTITEDIKSGWYLKDLTCSNNANVSIENRTATVTVTPGSQTICTFHNAKYGKIIGVKFDDKDADTRLDILDEPLLNGWQIFIDANKDGIYNDGERSTLTTYKIGKYELGAYRFDNLLPGTYQVCEVPQVGWYSTSGSNCQTVTINSYGGDIDDINFSNRRLSNLTVYKFNDLDGNGFQNEGEETLSDWTINLSDQKSKITEDGKVEFTNLMPGNFVLSENLFNQSGWKQTNIYCDLEENIDKDNSHEVLLASGQNKICYIGNQRLAPKTTITKSNNSGGIELTPGGLVEYSINVAFADNSVNNLKVTDLLSNGFKYKAGSYKVYKTSGSVITDVTSSVTEPEYHSPGVWDLTALGKLTPEDTVKLVYSADIATDQQAGKYADLAWSIANYFYDSSKSVLALAGTEGKVDTNFVGTEVSVGGNYQNSVSAEVKQENHTSGQVLGASTELPSTGAATIWMIISGLLGLVGFGFIKFNKKTMLTILLTLLSFGLIISPVRAESSNLSVRLEQPKTPSRIKEIELKYVALDIQGRGITTYCLKKGPTDSGFVQFSSETLSGVNGNASHCSLSSAITDAGSYQFQVKAVAGGEEVTSNTVSLDYKNSTPGTPIDYRKENVGNNCDFKIHFKTADDSGKTVKVELYRSTDSNFSANNESLVVSTDIGSNQEKDILNSVPDCSKTYYFALRAFDNAGNGSGLVGDKVYSTVTDGTTTVTSTTTTNSGAIPVSGAVILKEGDTDQSNLDSSSTDETGQVLGTRTAVKNVVSRHPFITALIVILILGIIIYAFKKIRKGKKIVAKKKK